ncbi:hypothetical protein [Methylophaga sp.]|uniref:hypothetical protein n=1 Tax=Methylophaga sp. TaxID=2024840 RepID=UPI0025DCE38E|nr:hypothetical protein [Methylophaga sp.]
MNEIPRLSHYNMVTVSTPAQVGPARPIADKTKSVSEFDRRHQPDRRKRNKKPRIERRVSSDRRAPRFDAKV